jgi:hypothetical protein
MESSLRTEKLETLVQEMKHASLAIHHTFAETDHKNVHPMPAADNNQLNMRLNLIADELKKKADLSVLSQQAGILSA